LTHSSKTLPIVVFLAVRVAEAVLPKDEVVGQVEAVVLNLNRLDRPVLRPDAGASLEDIYPSGNTLPSLFPQWDQQEPTHTYIQDNLAPLFEADAHSILYYGNGNPSLFPASDTLY
jgi:hypothetical protein